MYRFPYSAVCLLIASFGFFACGQPGSAFDGNISTRQEEDQVEDRDDPPRHEIEEMVAEPMSLKMELLPEDFDRHGPAARRTINRDGMATTTARDADRDIKITEDVKTGIVIEVTRTYGPQDFDALKKLHPKLVDYVEMFPDRVDNHEIELNLAIKTVYRALTLAELKKRHPEAFTIYLRYHANAEEPVR